MALNNAHGGHLTVAWKPAPSDPGNARDDRSANQGSLSAPASRFVTIAESFWSRFAWVRLHHGFLVVGDP